MKSKIKKIIYFILLCIVTNASLLDNANAFLEEEAYEFAEFIISISQNINTPKKGGFCTYGNDHIIKVLVKLNPDIIEIDEHLTNIKLCKMTYISLDKQKWFKYAGKIFLENKIATFAIYNGFSLDDNSSIEIQIGRRSFELLVNKKNLKANGIKLSPLITNLVIN